MRITKCSFNGSLKEIAYNFSKHSFYHRNIASKVVVVMSFVYTRLAKDLFDIIKKQLCKS